MKSVHVKHPPLISILIPTYNYATFLGEALDSVLSQTFQDYEVIICDNCSTDNTRQIVDKYLFDKRISYYCNDENIGLAGNLNKCLAYASGTYIKFLMADDKFHPSMLKRFVEVMQDNKNVAIVTSYREAFGLKQKLMKQDFSGLVGGEKMINKCLNNGRGNIIGEPTTVMFRREHLELAGNFNSYFTCLLDLDLWLRLLSFGDCFIIPEVLSYYRIHHDQLSSKWNYKNLFDEYNFYKRIQKSNVYHLYKADLYIDTVVKKDAIKCSRVIYRTLTKLHLREAREMFLTAVKIGLTEHVLFDSFVVEMKKQFSWLQPVASTTKKGI